MAIYDGSKYNGLSYGFRILLQSQVPLEPFDPNEKRTSRRIWTKEEKPSYIAEVNPDKRLIDTRAAEAAKRQEQLPPIKLCFLADGPDMTVDEQTVYPRQVVVEGMRGSDTILDLKRKVADQESKVAENLRVFLPPHELRDETCLGECYIQWSGFGLDDWPPKFVVKPRVTGFEVSVDVPATRETAVWNVTKGKLQRYGTRRLIFDLALRSTVRDVKALIERRLGVPAERQLLVVQVAFLGGRSDYGGEVFIDLDDDSKAMADYGITRCGTVFKLRISKLDAEGRYIFDDDPLLDDSGLCEAAGQDAASLPTSSPV